MFILKILNSQNLVFGEFERAGLFLCLFAKISDWATKGYQKSQMEAMLSFFKKLLLVLMKTVGQEMEMNFVPFGSNAKLTNTDS